MEEEEKGPIHVLEFQLSQVDSSQVPFLRNLGAWLDWLVQGFIYAFCYLDWLVPGGGRQDRAMHYLQGFIYRLENRKIDTEYLLASSSSIYPRKLNYPWSFKTASLSNNNH